MKMSEQLEAGQLVHLSIEYDEKSLNEQKLSLKSEHNFERICINLRIVLSTVF